MDIASLRAKLDNIAEELAQLPEQESVAIEEETIEEADMMPKTLKCKECGDMLGNPTTDCHATVWIQKVTTGLWLMLTMMATWTWQ